MDSFDMGTTVYQPNNLMYVEVDVYNSLIESNKNLSKTVAELTDIIIKMRKQNVNKS